MCPVQGMADIDFVAVAETTTTRSPANRVVLLGLSLADVATKNHGRRWTGPASPKPMLPRKHQIWFRCSAARMKELRRVTCTS